MLRTPTDKLSSSHEELRSDDTNADASATTDTDQLATEQKPAAATEPAKVIWKTKREDTYTLFAVSGDPKYSVWHEITLFKNKIRVTATRETIHRLGEYCRENHVTANIIALPMTTSLLLIEATDAVNFAKIMLAYLDEQKDDVRTHITELLKTELINLTLTSTQIEDLQSRMSNLETSLLGQANPGTPKQTVQQPAMPLTFSFNPSATIHVPINFRDTQMLTFLQRAIINKLDQQADLKERKSYFEKLLAQGANPNIKMERKFLNQYSELERGSFGNIELANRHDEAYIYNEGDTPIVLATKAAFMANHFTNEHAVSQYALFHFAQAQALLAAGANPYNFNCLPLLPMRPMPSNEHATTQVTKFRFSPTRRVHAEFIANFIAMLLHYGAKTPTLEQFNAARNAYVTTYLNTPQPDDFEDVLEFNVLKAKILKVYNNMQKQVIDRTVDMSTPDVTALKPTILNKCERFKSLEEIGAEARKKWQDKAEKERIHNAANKIETAWIKHSYKKKKQALQLT